MDKEQIKQSLDHLAAQGIRNSRNLWPRIQDKAQARAARSAWWVRLSPAARLGWALVLLVGVLSIGMTVYAASPVIGRLFIMDDQLKDQDYSKLGQHFEISQTQGDVTITLQWAYADAKRVLVGYTVQSADGRRFDTFSTLADASGAVYSTNGSYGVTGQSDILQVSLPPSEGANLAIFTMCAQSTGEKSSTSCEPVSPYAATSPDGTQTLKLHFTVQANYYIYPTQAPTAQDGRSNGSGQPENMTAEGQPVTLGETIGPFIFDFSLPVGQSAR